MGPPDGHIPPGETELNGPYTPVSSCLDSHGGSTQCPLPETGERRDSESVFLT